VEVNSLAKNGDVRIVAVSLYILITAGSPT
jgi:hypothetical protein